MYKTLIPVVLVLLFVSLFFYISRTSKERRALHLLCWYIPCCFLKSSLKHTYTLLMTQTFEGPQPLLAPIMFRLWVSIWLTINWEANIIFNLNWLYDWLAITLWKQLTTKCCPLNACSGIVIFRVWMGTLLEARIHFLSTPKNEKMHSMQINLNLLFYDNMYCKCKKQLKTGCNNISFYSHHELDLVSYEKTK